MKNPDLESEASLGDEVLMEAVRTRNGEALAELYDRYRPMLRSIVVKILGDEADADDVLQDVFVQLWARADDYSAARGKPLGWLITLARRRGIDRLRQRAAYQRATDRFEIEVRDPVAQTSTAAPATEGGCEGDVREIVQTALRRLPDPQRLALERAFLHGRTQREVAADLQVPLGTVKTRINLGLRKLGRVLAGARRTEFQPR